MTKTIAELNDSFRHDGVPGRVVVTPGISDRADLSSIMNRVADFNAFTEDNDPYDEHDFGSLEARGDKVFWKIDYYDKNTEYGSPDPTDPSVTTRVLTVMLAEEY